MKSRDYLEGYNDCLTKMQSALYDIQNDLIDMCCGVGSKLSEAEDKHDGAFALQDVVLYNDIVWKTQRAGMVASVSNGDLVIILSEKGTVVTERPKDITYIGHIRSIKHPETLIDAIKEVKRHYMEANKK